MPFSLQLVTQNIHQSFPLIQKNIENNNFSPNRFHQVPHVVPQHINEKTLMDNPSKHTNAQNVPTFKKCIITYMQG
jgi:hypothetical protein